MRNNCFYFVVFFCVFITQGVKFSDPVYRQYGSSSQPPKLSESFVTPILPSDSFKPSYNVLFTIDSTQRNTLSSSIVGPANWVTIRNGCKAVGTTNIYGWDAVKTCLWSRVPALISGAKTFQITLDRCPFLALKEAEVVKCDGLAATLTNPNEGTDPFSFTIDLDDIAPSCMLSGIGYIPPLPALTGSSIAFKKPTAVPNGGTSIRSFSLYEHQMKRDGISFTLSLFRDAWDKASPANIFAGFSCMPGSCVPELVKPEYFSYSWVTPTMLNVTIPPTIYDISQEITLQFDVAVNMLYKKKKNVGDPTSFQIVIKETKVNIITYFVVCKPDCQQPPKAITITEDCIRGLEPASCFGNQQFGFGMNTKRSQVPATWVVDSDSKSKFPELFSGSLGQFDRVKKDTVKLDPKSPVDPGTSDSTFLKFDFVPVPDYECWADETISFFLHPSLVNFYEPITVTNNATAKLIITPSPGRMTGTVAQYTERDLRQGKIRFTMTMKGESWDPNGIRQIAVNSVPSVRNDEGWDGYYSTILPVENIFWNIDNSTMVVLQFVAFKPYDIPIKEDITFNIIPDMIRSRIPLKQPVSGNVISIIPTEGEADFMTPSVCVSEYVMQYGPSFNITIDVAGDTFDKTTFQQAIASGITSNTTDPKGFAVLLRTSFLQPSAFTYVAKRRVVLTINPNPSYNTKQGEYLFFTLPKEAVSSKLKPIGSGTMCVSPLQGNIRLQILKTFRGQQTWLPSNAVGEDEIRGDGGVTLELFVTIYNDTLAEAGAFTDAVFQELINNVNGSSSAFTAWNEQRRAILSVGASRRVNDTTLAFALAPNLVYDIPFNETITLGLFASNTDSKLEVLNTVSFLIYVTPGLVLWMNPFTTISEDDVREGDVVFTFDLYGDQWSRNRSAYALSFFSSDKYPWNFQRKADSLVPDVNADDTMRDLSLGYHRLVLPIQHEPSYDIASIETVTISFIGNTMRSGVKARQENVQFQVTPTPGRVVISGYVHNLLEKHVRTRSDIYFYLTLFGERFVNESCILKQISLVRESVGGLGFQALSDKLLPPDSVAIEPSREVASIHMVPNRKFDIVTPETLNVITLIKGMYPCVLSGIAPLASSTTIDILPSGGEIYLLPPFNYSEQAVRGEIEGISLTLQIDGDKWLKDVIVRDVNQGYVRSIFLQYLKSDSNTLEELFGFSMYAGVILDSGRNSTDIKFQNEDTQLVIPWYSTDKYDIAQSETIHITIPSGAFVKTQIAPDPNHASFIINPYKQVFVAIIDDNTPMWKTPGLNANVLFIDTIARIFGISSNRVHIEETNRRLDEKKKVQFTFLPSNRVDEKNSAAVGNALMAISASDTSFLYDKLSIISVYDIKSPPKETVPNNSSQPNTKKEVDSGNVLGQIFWFTMIGLFIAGLFVILFMINRKYRNR
eukprot:PhF_6_TR27942/c0_g1_i2/m.41190